MLAAISVALSQNIKLETIKSALAKISGVPGRLEFIQRQPFAVVIDYAHTPDALRKVYQTLTNRQPVPILSSISSKKQNRGSSIPQSGIGTTYNTRLICVLGAAGGGRDKWKRPEMGKIASEFCDEIILTNEDPYDENPLTILDDIERGFLSNSKFSRWQSHRGLSTKSEQIQNSKFKIQNCVKMMDRRKAIRHALEIVGKGDILIITGKGAEPYIMGPNNTKILWDDREVARQELKNTAQ